MSEIDSAANASSDLDFGTVFDAMSCPSLIIAPDTTIVAMNDAFLRHTGIDRHQSTGKLLFDVFPENPDSSSANGEANVRASLARVLHTKLAEAMPIQRYDIRMPGNPDTFIEHYWQAVNTPIMNRLGAVTHVLHQVEDVTKEIQSSSEAVTLRAQAALRDHPLHDQRYMAELFHQSPSFMAMLVGPSHRVEFVNIGYLKLIGHRDIVGMTVAEGLPEAVAQGFIEVLDNVYRSGTPYVATAARYEVQLTPGGVIDRRYLDFVYQPFRDANGQVTGILVQGVDVTERILADARRSAFARLNDVLSDHSGPEEIIVRAAAILGELLNVSRVGYATIDSDTETLQVIREWNAAGVEGLPATLNLRAFGSFIDDMKAGKFIAVEDVRVDPRTSDAALALIERKAGAFVNVPVFQHGRLAATIYVNSATARQWVVEDLSLILDVAERLRMASERLRSDIALRLSEAKFRTIADAMPQMVWSTLPDGFHDYYNQQWYDFTGAPNGSTDGEAWNDMFHPDDQARAWSRWRDCLASGVTYEIQYRLRHHSGQYRWVLGRALPVRSDAGAIVRWMGTCTDIHAQKLAEDEMELASRRKDEFLAMLAHELRNPLAPISTAAQLLKIQGGNEARVHQASDIITRQVKHMTDLVDDLLDVSRVTRGLVQLQLQTLDMKTIVNVAIEQARPLIEARHHDLLLRITASQTYVRGDRTRLVQAMANLLNNAAKYTQQRGEIALTLDVHGARVRISVADNGIGIEPELLPSVFDLFTQAERTPDRAQGGLGLGLALVKSIAMLHEGSVYATSGGAGKGSTFTINLPLVSPEEPALASAAYDEMARSTRSLRVMVVDDNEDAAMALGALLEAAGHHVLVFVDGESALHAATKDDVDVFILDIGLPIIDGYELARRLRAGAKTSAALLIALTGYDQAHDHVLSRSAGFDHHFVKPLDDALLWKALAGYPVR